MTPQDIILGVRRITGDEEIPLKDTDAQLLARINDCLSVMVDIRPDLFSATGAHVCSAGPDQTLAFARARSILEVVSITAGPAVLPADRGAMDRFNPGWRNSTGAAASNWMPIPDSPLSFSLYPPALSGQSVDVRYVQPHAILTTTSSTINLLPNYGPAIEAYVVWIADAGDDPDKYSSTSVAFLGQFAALLGVKPAAVRQAAGAA